MALSGFVKLRRAIREHLESGRITFEEYGVFTVLLINADHRSGVWRGCALTLAKHIGKSERWVQRVLARLRDKAYIFGAPSNGRGRYAIRVNKYFNKASVVTPSVQEGVCGDTFRPNKASVVTPYQEVSTYKNKIGEEPTAPLPVPGEVQCKACGYWFMRLALKKHECRGIRVVGA